MNTLRVSIVAVTVVIGVQCFDQFTNPDFAYSLDTDEMSGCSFRGNGSEGVCQPVDQCPGAVSDYRVFNLMPTHCGFNGRSPVVCCASAKKSAVNLGKIGSSSNIVNRISAMRKLCIFCELFCAFMFVLRSKGKISVKMTCEC